MADLKTKYMGLSLENPFVVASCSLTKTVEGVRRCADAGAGAVVLKSIFEEQIRAETKDTIPDTWFHWHPEAYDFIDNMVMELGPRQYLDLIEKAKAGVSVPVIASLHCLTPSWWIDYALQIQEAGADALELNIAAMPSDPNRDPAEIERRYVEILKDVLSQLKIPVAVKIGPQFTSVARIARELDRAGASALVLFNRLYRIDFDIQTMKVVSGMRFSTPDEISTSLRWVALLSGRLKCDLAASTGVHDGAGAIKQILAGAAVIQLCSTLYLGGLERLAAVRTEVESWMKEKGFDSVDRFRGRMSRLASKEPELYERLQYIKVLTGVD